MVHRRVGCRWKWWYTGSLKDWKNLCGVKHVNHSAFEWWRNIMWKHIISENYKRRAIPQMKHISKNLFHLCRVEGEKTQKKEKRVLWHTWELVWFPVRSCTTSAQPWGRPDRPPSGSFHLYPPDMLVPVSLQKLWKGKEDSNIKILFWPDMKTDFHHPKRWFTFAFLLLFRDLLHPPQQTPQICDAVHKGDLLVLIWSGVLQDLPHINLWSVIHFHLPSGAGYEGTMWGSGS